MTRQSLTKHGASDAHADAVKLEMNLSVSQQDGVIVQSFCAVQSAERKAMIGAMKYMYWLCRQEVPHTINFSALLELAKSLGATYLSDFCLEHFNSLETVLDEDLQDFSIQHPSSVLSEYFTNGSILLKRLRSRDMA